MVVTITTPLAALVPYIAEAEASFNTSMDSILFGFTSLRFPPGTPSMIIKGSALLRVPVPLILIDPWFPGAPPFLTTLTPAALPCNACAAPDTGIFSRLSPFIEDTAPVTSRFSCVPYPTTNTSLREDSS